MVVRNESTPDQAFRDKAVKVKVGKLTPAPELRKKGLGAVELVRPGEGVDDEHAGDRAEEVSGLAEVGVEGGQRPAMRGGSERERSIEERGVRKDREGASLHKSKLDSVFERVGIEI